MKIELELKGLEAATKTVGAEKADTAMSRALARISGPLRSAALREIRAKYNLPRSERVKDAVKIYKGYRPAKLTIATRGKTPGLHHYAGKQTKTGVSVLVRRDRGRKKLRHAFLAPGAGGKGLGLWHREGAKVLPSKGRYAGTGIKRQPLTRLFGPDIVGMMKKFGVGKIREVLVLRWDKEFDRELKWLLK